jgi:hypothetical protein
MSKSVRWMVIGLILVLGFCLGTLGFSEWNQVPTPVERVTWSSGVQWIGPSEASYRFYARRTVYITDKVRVAWLRLSADNDFVLYVNGQPIASRLHSLSNPNHLSSGLRDTFQNINDSRTYRDNGVIKYMLSHTRQWKLPLYVNLIDSLKPGKNVIALEVQKGQQNPRAVVEGIIRTGSDAINLSTGTSAWQAEILSYTHQNLFWFESDFPDQDWPTATVLGPVKEATYSRLNQQLYEWVPEGDWITGGTGAHPDLWLRGDWNITAPAQRAYIRIAGNGQYFLLLNGALMNQFTISKDQDLNLYEVTNFLKTGRNTLVVHGIAPLDSNATTTQRYPLEFFVDGWAKTTANSSTAAIKTDSTWHTVLQPTPEWLDGSGQTGEPVIVVKPVDPESLAWTFVGNAYLGNVPNYLWQQSCWLLAGIGFAFVLAWRLGWAGLGFGRGIWSSIEIGAGLLLPGTFFLTGIGLLKHRYALTEEGLLFAQPQSNTLILLSFLAILLVTLLWSQIKRRISLHSNNWFAVLPYLALWFVLGVIMFVVVNYSLRGDLTLKNLPRGLPFVGCIGLVTSSWLWKPQRLKVAAVLSSLQSRYSIWPWLALCLIALTGFGLRIYNLNSIDLDNDENTSLDAIRGILRTGAPEAKSGILYTRGPLFHYLMALWLRLIGDTSYNARLLMVILGAATLILAFLITRKITGKIWVALLVTALLSIDPWELFYSRNIRFYQPAQFTSLLALLFFIKGFIEKAGRLFQYGFFIAIASTLLIQEVNIVLVPGYLIGFLVFYQPFRLTKDWPIILCSLITMASYALNGFIFKVLCLTPWISLSANVSTQLKLSVGDVTSYITHFFLDSNRLYVIYSLFFLLGFIYFLKHKNSKVLFMFSLVIIHITLLTFLAPGVAGRYTYATYPLLIILSTYSAVCLVLSLGNRLEQVLNSSLPLKNIAVLFLALLLASNIQPEKVLGSYQYAINRQYTQVFDYIQKHRQPGDIVIANVSSTSVNTLKKLDYIFPTRGILPLDTVYLHDGRLIDRWSGAIALTNLDQMNHILESANRVWLQLDDTKRPNNPELLRLYNYFQTLGKPAYETFGTRVRLWSRADGFLPRMPNRGQDLGLY